MRRITLPCKLMDGLPQPERVAHACNILIARQRLISPVPGNPSSHLTQ
ncbi:hypothetical protein [Natronospira bacteriovora]|uniref:Uncharacterized protein n=1 Tax=Natronospira bacteriovora TaxID=3069753 RepID=A0ABU0W3D2_9GAMM|nr:hypothetical protein [Natronospira sp. AB-CW4]MDQ2068524.1 hypothetical protein [Natronospira sp. AB-CW4]